jgi:hypothetical protein
VEFNDSNADGMYNSGEECINGLTAIDQNGMQFRFYRPVLDVLGTTTFSGSSADGLFTVVFHLGNTTFVRNGRTVYPTSVKFDLILDFRSYSRKCASNSRFALIARAKSRERSRESDTDSSAGSRAGDHSTTVSFGSAATPSGFFSWSTTVNATTATSVLPNTAVLFSGLRDDASNSDLRQGENSKIAFYSFDVVNPVRIEWDPEFGYASSNAANKIALGFWMVILTLLSLFATHF